MKIAIGIAPQHLAEVAHALNILLADEHVLYIQTRNAHWNVEGSDFLTKHRFFEEQYQQIETIIDSVAERIRTLGHYAEATMAGFLKLTHLTEATREKNDSTGFIKSLLASHETIIIHLRENIEQFSAKWKDAGTSDFITGLMETHEKMAWMLRAHLK
ncbi:MAG: DNA starvation/stationary phase protection protein [Sphingobacteriales bacterium]|nr:MAG: DNA starvation/stationary phase protection protein [Sphingobacteriales bacterium]